MPILNIPNLLTLARLASLPFVIVLFNCGHAFAAACVFVLAMVTDCLDGWLAKRLDQRTALGLYLDPVVDKIVILVLFYEFGRAGLIGWAVPHLFLARELLQNAVRAVAASRGTVLGANWMGKVKALLQTVLITWGLLMSWLTSRFPDVAVDGLRVGLGMSAWGVLGLAWAFFGVFVYWNRHAAFEVGTKRVF